MSGDPGFCEPTLATSFEGRTASGPSALRGSCGGGEAPETVISFCPSRSGTYEILAQGYDTVLYVRSRGTEIACNDDGRYTDRNGRRLSDVTVTLEAGRPIEIVVDGYNASAYGNYSVSLTRMP
jgi:hypothetical protein